MDQDKLKFYRGLLYGLRLKRDSFRVDSRFHQAFEETVQNAMAELPSDLQSMIPKVTIDPMFGACHEAREMLLEGEQDLLLSILRSPLQKAQFKIVPEQARRELDILVPSPAGTSAFEKLGGFFNDRLGE